MHAMTTCHEPENMVAQWSILLLDQPQTAYMPIMHPIAFHAAPATCKGPIYDHAVLMLK